MNSQPAGYKAIVLGATGAIGGAFVKALQRKSECAGVIGLSRHSDPAFDLANEDSIAECARTLAPRGPFDLIIDAKGIPTIDGIGPERRLRDLDAARLSRAFLFNAIGPALQPGTVRSPLSAPFLAGAEAMDPDVSAALLLVALDATPASGEAVFIDYRGRSIEW